MRLPDWEPRLNEYIAAHNREAFAYGKLDCVLFAAGAIAAMTGDDPAAHIRGKYKTPRGALGKLVKHGHATVEEMMDARFAGIHPAKAHRGDIVMLPTPENEGSGTLGICMGRKALFVGAELVPIIRQGEEADALTVTAGSREGLIFVPMPAAVRAWKIPY